MSNTELIAELDLKKIPTEKNENIPEAIGIDTRSHDMLLVLNEVFDSIYPSNKSLITNF